MTKITQETSLAHAGKHITEVPVVTDLSTTLKEKNPLCLLGYLLWKEKFLTGVALSVACLSMFTFCRRHLHRDQPSGEGSSVRLVSFQTGCC